MTSQMAERSKRKQISRACFYCRKAHTACNDIKPCDRCERMNKICFLDIVDRKPASKERKKDKGDSCVTMVTLKTGQVVSLETIEMFIKDCSFSHIVQRTCI